MFWNYLAKLDIRQESSRHTQLISELVKKKYNKNYIKFSENEKIDFLKSKINSSKNFINKFQFKNNGKIKKFGILLMYYLKNHQSVLVHT